MRRDIQEIIEKRLINKWKFFVGAPGYATDKGLDADAVSRITGMKTDTFETDNAEKADFRGELFGFTRPVSPCFRIVDSEAEVWAMYENGGIAVAEKGNTIYSAVGRIPAAVWTEACRISGVHIYCTDGAGLAVCSSFICTNTLKDGVCRITMPYDCTLEDVFTGERYKTHNCVYEYDKPTGTTVFLKITGKEAGYENN